MQSVMQSVMHAVKIILITVSLLAIVVIPTAVVMGAIPLHNRLAMVGTAVAWVACLLVCMCSAADPASTD
jgi:hypothetical protein